MRAFVRVLQTTAAVLIGTFFAFVGWMKTFAPVALLAEHHAWTVWLPEWLGRIIGISELACAVGLILPVAFPRFAVIQRASALILIVNQLAAAAFHAAHGETGALPQNVVLIAALAFVAIGRANQPRGENG